MLNKGATGTIFITSLVWRSPWLGIEPGTSRTRSQHSTTRLSRRRFWIWILYSFITLRSQNDCTFKYEWHIYLFVLTIFNEGPNWQLSQSSMQPSNMVLLLFKREPVFPFSCWVLTKGSTGTIVFITSLVRCGHWLGLKLETCTLETSTIPLSYSPWAGLMFTVLEWALCFRISCSR